MSEQETLLSIKNLKTYFVTEDAVLKAVDDVSFEVRRGETLGVVGESGCGKSTTLRMIAGLEEITEGELYIGDQLMNDVVPKDRDIAMVFQNYALYPHMTVFENMAFGLKLRKVPKDVIKQKVQEAAQILGIEHLLDRKPKALSGGQRQRVALGRAIVREPKVFLMDEPLSNLDAKLRVQMRTEIGKLHKNLQTTFIYVTHDQTEAMTMGTRIVVMKDGVIQQVDSPTNLYLYPCNMFVAGFIGSPQMNFIEVTVDCKPDGTYLRHSNFSIKLPDGKGKKEEVKAYNGATVIMGIRPEDIYDDEAFISSAPDCVATVDIDLTEMMGAETYLYFKIEDINFTARVNPRTTTAVGQTVKIAMDANKIHLFDKDTEKCIIH